MSTKRPRLVRGDRRAAVPEAFIHIEAYAGAARAFDSYRIAQQVFAEQHETAGR
jgi:4-carboxymuconolactone decarboxylase